MYQAVWSGSKRELLDLLRSLPQLVATGVGPWEQVARAVGVAIGAAALADIHEAYIQKSRGGSDEMGIQWEPLAPRTIAQRLRRGKAQRAAARRLRQMQAQRAQLESRYMQEALDRLSLRGSVGPREKALARKAAEVRLRAEMGVLEAAASGSVEILRDTGRLLNSLSPGEAYGAIYQKPNGDQVFEVQPGVVAVGTQVEYGQYHQYGTRRMSARPFLPPSDDRIPASWWQKWKDAAAAALALGISETLRG